MNEDSLVNTPEQPEDIWETTVRDTARHFTYPTTPDISRRVRMQLTQRRLPTAFLKMVAAVILAVMIIIATVPEVRAFVVEVIRIGAIQIFVGQPTAVPTSVTSTATPNSSSRYKELHLLSALEMPNEMALDDAVKQLTSPIQLPTYPADIGKPDHVYVQRFEPGVLVTLVWLVPGEPDRVWLTLDVLNSQMIASKFIDDDGQHQSTKVNAAWAEWLPAAHKVAFFGGKQEITRLVNGNVLIWLVGQYGKLTYRLEGAISLEEAIKIAESFREMGTP